jgi:hypothetical protein
MKNLIARFVPQNFNDFLAIIVVIVVVAYVVLATAMNWDNKIIDLAMGVFLAKFSDIVQFYFRKSKTEDARTKESTIPIKKQEE